MTGRLARTCAALLLLAAATAALAGCLPYERLQSAGAWIRRASDVTPERYVRYLHVCWFFAAVLGLAAWQVWRRSGAATAAQLPRARAAIDAGTASGWTRALLLAVLVVGGLLRLQRVDEPMAYDEAYSYLNFASRPWYEAIGDYNSTNNHLLNTLLMHVAARLFGPEEWALRWHVLIAGSLLPWAAYVWARDWLGAPAALPTAACVAVSGLLIAYSADARGYILVALAALLWDQALSGLGSAPGRGAWWSAWGALVAGLCAMPIMLYAATASSSWFLLVGARGGAMAFRERAWTLATIWGPALVAVAAFYAPAYIFRGLMFLEDPIMQSVSRAEFIRSLGAGWLAAWGWWTAGPIPGWVWGGLIACGAVTLPDQRARLRWGLPFVTVLVLNLIQQVAPPPRIYLHLAPWVFVAAAWGAVRLLQTVRAGPQQAGWGIALLLLAVGGGYAAPRPVLFDPRERSDYVSVPDAVLRIVLDVQARPRERHVLLAPLPCDLPAIFYLRRAGVELPVNEPPRPGDRVWLIARPHETPGDVLSTPLLQMEHLASRFVDWELVGRYETLRLYRSSLRRDGAER